MDPKVIRKITRIASANPFYVHYDFNHWDRIAVLTKQDVMRNYSKISNVGGTSPYYVARTSGSSGTILSIPWNCRDILFSVKQLWDQRKKYGISIKDPYITCHANYYYGNELIDNRIIVNKNCHSISKVHMTVDDIAYYVNHIIEIQPSWMLLQPSVAYALGVYIAKNDLVLHNLKLIELTGEIVTPELALLIKHCYGNITITNNYGMQEFQGIAYGLADNTFLECMENNVFVEIIDENDQPVDDGIEGRVVVTGLCNTSFPLIRYETGDKGIMRTVDGRRFLCIKEARSNDVFVYKEKRYDASLFFNIIERLNAEGYSIIQFQFFYDGKTLTALLYSYDESMDCTNIARRIDDILKSTYSITLPSISVKKVREFIKPQTNNKYKYFTNI